MAVGYPKRRCPLLKSIGKKANRQPSTLLTRMSKEKSRIAFILAFGLPTLALYIWFCVSPIFTSIYSSFFSWSGFSSMKPVGFKNYEIILKDPIFYKAIKNDFTFVLGKELLIVPLTLLFAVALTRLRLKKFEVNFYRFLFYLPNVLSVIIIAIVWAFIYDPYNGLLNGILEVVGLSHLIPKDGWLVSYTVPSVIVVASWCGIGLHLIMMISAINSISPEIFEAADIDGAGQWKQLWSITIPCVWNQIKVLVTSIIFNTLGNYVLIMTMANGGVDGSGMVMGLYVYQYGIDSTSPKVGYANAAAVLLLIISATTTMIVNGLMSRKEQD